MNHRLLPHLCCLLFLSLDAFSQRVTFSDLKYVLYHDLSDNEDYLIKKGFLYAGVRDYEDGLYDLNYSKNSRHSKQYIQISKKMYKEEFSYQSSFYTVLQSDYTLFKNQVKQLGFILKKSARYEESTVFDYEKGNLVISFLITPTDEDFPDYYITLTDKTLEKKYFKVKGD